MRKLFYIRNDFLHGRLYGPVVVNNHSVIVQPQIGIQIGKELPGSECIQRITRGSKCSQPGLVKPISSFLRCRFFQPSVYIGHSGHDSFRWWRMRFGQKSVWVGYLAQHPKHYENRNDPIEHQQFFCHDKPSTIFECPTDYSLLIGRTFKMKFPSFKSSRSIGMKLKSLTDQWGELLGSFPTLHQKRQAARGGILAMAVSDVRQFVSNEKIQGDARQPFGVCPTPPILRQYVCNGSFRTCTRFQKRCVAAINPLGSKGGPHGFGRCIPDCGEDFRVCEHSIEHVINECYGPSVNADEAAPDIWVRIETGPSIYLRGFHIVEIKFRHLLSSSGTATLSTKRCLVFMYKFVGSFPTQPQQLVLQSFGIAFRRVKGFLSIAAAYFIEDLFMCFRGFSQTITGVQ